MTHPTPAQRPFGSKFAPLTNAVKVTANYTVPLGVRMVAVDASGGTAVTVTLPASSTMVGDGIIVKNILGGAAVTVVPFGSETLDRGTSDVLAVDAAVHYRARPDGAGWWRT